VGFGAQGVWPDNHNQATCSVARSHDSNLIASAEDSGIVKLFRYPSMVKRAAFSDARGHSSRVNHMAFSAGDKFLVTVSGQDRAVFVWTVEKGDE
jgi:microtubule-associated protein-like 6